MQINVKIFIQYLLGRNSQNYYCHCFMLIFTIHIDSMVMAIIIILVIFINLLSKNLDKTVTRDHTDASLESASRCG